MKHYFKKLSIFLYICVALIVYSCAEEKDFVKEQNHEKIKMEDQSFDKLLQLPVFNDAYQRVVKAKVKIPNSTMARTALEEQYGFDIVTQVHVRIITTTDKGTFYVLLIERPTKEYLKFENLIINVKETVVGALIMKYELSKLAEKEVYHDSYSMDIVDTAITLLEVDGKIVFQNCIDTYTLMCNAIDLSDPTQLTNHIPNWKCWAHGAGLYVEHWQVCTSIDEATGGSSSGPAGASGGASAGSVYASPLPCLECVEEMPSSPCNKIKKQMNKFSTIKQALIELNSTVNQDHENGIFVDKTATPTSSNIIQTIPNNSNVGGSIIPNMNPTSKYIMIAHTHDFHGETGAGTYSIFSWDDLSTINNLIKNNHIDNSEFVFYVLTADNTRYALTFDNTIDISDFFYTPSTVLGDIVDSKKFLQNNELFRKYYGGSLITTTSDKDTDKISFLNFIKEANLGVSIFEVDETFTNFEKLSLDNSGDVKKTPCNN